MAAAGFPCQILQGGWRANRRHNRQATDTATAHAAVPKFLTPALSRLLEPALRNVQYFEKRRWALGGISIVAFPLYYYIWRYLYPQPYENLPLRLLGCLLFIPLLFSPRWPPASRRLLSHYWYLALLYALPFFFTFMMLMNGGNHVSAQSTLVAVFIMVLLLDWMTLLVQFAVGTALAWLAYVLVSDAPLAILDLGWHLPIILLAVVLGAAANYKLEMVRSEQERAMLATAGSIAHELRTPLLGIRAGAAGLKGFLPTLLHAYQLARGNGLPVAAIRAPHLNAMKGVLERIEMEADYSNAIIDILITNVRLADSTHGEHATCSAARCVETALRRYPFSERERALVTWRPEGDFTFAGTELLMVHVLFNLIKNALRHIATAGKGEIVIRLESSPTANRLLFRDSGSGIPPEVLPHIFARFYTTASGGDALLGSGVGLAFCRDVMAAFSGTIECRSIPERHTEFILTFPPVAQ